MTTYDELVELERRMSGARVLSVYLPGPGRDPALRAAPRTMLDSALSRLRHELVGAPHAEREAFVAASEHVLRRVDGNLPAHASGVAIFADENGVRHVGGLAEAPAPVVEWKEGAVLAPYLASAARARSAIVALIDSRDARVLKYHDGRLDLMEKFHARAHVEEPIHMGDQPHGPFHAGVRGETGTDETERREWAAFDRMLHPVLHRIELAVHPDLWLIVAGMPQSVRLLVASLPRALSGRTELVSGLTLDSSDAEIAHAADNAMRGLEQRHDASVVEHVLDKGRAGDRAAIGWRETMLALQERAASVVLMSEGFLSRSLRRAETLTRLGMEGGAQVEIIPGEGAARLDAESEGVAAELRFPVPFATLEASGLSTRAAASYWRRTPLKRAAACS